MALFTPLHTGTDGQIPFWTFGFIRFIVLSYGGRDIQTLPTENPNVLDLALDYH